MARDSNQHIKFLVLSTCVPPISESAPESPYPWVLPEHSVTAVTFLDIFEIAFSGLSTFHIPASSM